MISKVKNVIWLVGVILFIIPSVVLAIDLKDDCNENMTLNALLTSVVNGDFASIQNIAEPQKSKFHLAILSLNGQSKGLSKEESLTFLIGLAEKHCSVASIALGYYFSERNVSESIKWYELGAKDGDLFSEVSALSIGLIKNGDVSSLERLKSLALQNNTSAAFNLGVYYNSLNGKPNKNIAVEYFKKAANNGHAKSQYNLAVYNSKKGNAALYIRFLRESASQGYWMAQYQLAIEYLSGKYVEKNDAKFVEYMTILAEGGNMKAANVLGFYYVRAVSKLEDYDKAEKFLSIAAYKGDLVSKNWLVEFYKVKLQHKDSEEVRVKLTSLNNL